QRLHLDGARGQEIGGPLEAKAADPEGREAGGPEHGAQAAEQRFIVALTACARFGSWMTSSMARNLPCPSGPAIGRRAKPHRACRPLSSLPLCRRLSVLCDEEFLDRVRQQGALRQDLR